MEDNGTNLMAKINDKLYAVLAAGIGTQFIMFGICVDVPDTQSGLYLPSCLLLQVNRTDGSSGVWENIGSVDSPVWKQFDTITPSEIALTLNKFLVGDAMNKAVEKTVTINFAGDALGTHSHALQQSAGEVLTVNPGTGVSSAAVGAPIGNVESVYVTAAGGATGPYALVPGGVSPGVSQVGYDPTTGVFQFLAADAVTAATVQYVSRAVSDISGGTPSGNNTIMLS